MDELCSSHRREALAGVVFCVVRQQAAEEADPLLTLLLRYLFSLYQSLHRLAPHQAAQQLDPPAQELLHSLLSPGGRPAGSRRAAPPPPSAAVYNEEDVMARPAHVKRNL